MSEQTKRIKTRLLNKYDTELEWEKVANTYTPAKGELIISAPGATVDGVNCQYPVIRVGDGTTLINKLKIINPPIDWESSDEGAFDRILNKPALQKSGDQVQITATKGLTVPQGDLTVGNKSTAYYTNPMQMPHAVGGIPAGETFNNTHIQDLLTALLYPYTEPVLRDFTLTPDQGTREKGASCELTTASIKVGKRSANITKVELYRNNEVIKTLDKDALSEIEINYGGKVVNFLLEGDPITVDSSSDSVKFKVVVTDEENGTQTSNEKTYNFVYPILHGVVNNAEDITQNWVNYCATHADFKTIKNKGNISVTYTTDAQIPVFAYPASYGSLKSIVDPNNFTQTWTSMTLDLTHELSGTTVSYFVYYGGLSSAANVTYKFSW